jgi:hypothetical protein
VAIEIEMVEGQEVDQDLVQEDVIEAIRGEDVYQGKDLSVILEAEAEV